MVNWLVLTVAFVSLLKFTYVNGGGGVLLVGLLRFENAQNLNFNGGCCHGTRNSDGYCSDFCRNIFSVTVHGLNIPNETKQPSNMPTQKNNSVLFLSTGEHQGFHNPMSFDFDNWPGSVNITINVYDMNTTGPLVDSFFVNFNQSSPTILFTNQTLPGTRDIDPSKLKVLLRYYCHCDNNCSKNAVCPPLTSTLRPTTPGCGAIGNIAVNANSSMSKEENVITDCTTSPNKNYTTTVGLSSTSELDATPEVVTNNVTSELSSDATTTPSTSITTTTTDENTSRTSLVTSSIQSSSTEESTSTPSLSTSSISLKKSTQSGIPTPPSNTNTEGSTPPELFRVVNSDPMEFWPIIVGSVLGGLALIAIIGFLVFYKRYKKARWRQDIYNVNPKILHRLEENGTTGRSDVALEMEPV